MEKDLENVLYTPSQLELMVQVIANEISETYSNIRDGRELVLIGVLKGSFMFLSDLSRKLSVPHTIDFMSVSSYQDTESTGAVKINSDLKHSITGKHVIIVEDIIDSGLTLKNLVEILETRSPKSIEICCAFSKPSMRKINIDVHYTGLIIDPPMFIVGYGLDYNELFRNLNCVGIPSKEAIEKFKSTNTSE